MRQSGIGLRCAMAAVVIPLVSGGVAMAQSEDELRRQFDFWLGEWDVVNRFWSAEQGEARVPGAKLWVYETLDGDALVEHYRGSNWQGNDILGFSVRAYDPDKEKWVILLNWPAANAPFWTMEGGFHHNRGEFFGETTTPDGATRINRYTFSDSLPGFYRWDGSFSLDDGVTWAHPSYIMEGVLRDESAEPIDRAWLHGDDIDERCPGDERRELDFTVGSWSGTASQLQDDGSWRDMPATLYCQSILAGCAVMSEFALTTPSGDVYEEFDVGAYDSQLNQWVQYTLSSQSTSLKRYEGAAADDDGVITMFTTLPDGVIERVRRFPKSEAEFTWDASWSRDEGETWTVLMKGEFSRME